MVVCVFGGLGGGMQHPGVRAASTAALLPLAWACRNHPHMSI